MGKQPRTTQSPSQELDPAYCTPYPCFHPEVYIASPEHPTTNYWYFLHFFFLRGCSFSINIFLVLSQETYLRLRQCVCWFCYDGFSIKIFKSWSCFYYSAAGSNGIDVPWKGVDGYHGYHFLEAKLRLIGWFWKPKLSSHSISPLRYLPNCSLTSLKTSQLLHITLGTLKQFQLQLSSGIINTSTFSSLCTKSIITFTLKKQLYLLYFFTPSVEDSLNFSFLAKRRQYNFLVGRIDCQTGTQKPSRCYERKYAVPSYVIFETGNL